MWPLQYAELQARLAKKIVLIVQQSMAHYACGMCGSHGAAWGCLHARHRFCRGASRFYSRYHSHDSIHCLFIRKQFCPTQHCTEKWFIDD